MDEFFQKLREIQKKERTNSGMARVGNDFYHRVHRYLEELRDAVGNDPFAKEQYLLRDTQRIATEICERREHKITDSAVMNIQRSYHLFKGRPQFDLQDTTPLNLTPEEEQLYFSLIDILKNYRDKMIPSLDDLDELNERNPEIVKPVSKEESREHSREPSQKLSQEHSREPLHEISTESSKKPSKQPSQGSIKQKSDLGSGAVDESIIRDYLAATGTLDKNKNIDSVVNSKGEGVSSDQSNTVLEGNVPPQKSHNEPINQDIPDMDQQIPPNDLKSSRDSLEKSKAKIGKINLNMLVIFEEVPSIVGVDEKVYGPFCPQDVVILPEANAQIFINARKGRLIRS